MHAIGGMAVASCECCAYVSLCPTARSAARLVAEVEALKGRLAGERQAADSALRDADNEVVRLSTQIGDRDAEAMAMRAQVKELTAALEAAEARHAEALQALERAANDDAAFALAQLDEATRREHAAGDMIRALQTELDTTRVREVAAVTLPLPLSQPLAMCDVRCSSS